MRGWDNKVAWGDGNPPFSDEWHEKIRLGLLLGRFTCIMLCTCAACSPFDF
jgi:hypothetical protein